MSTLADYLAFAKAHPALFVNPPQDGITILSDEDEIQEAERQEARRLEKQGLPAEWAKVGIAYRDQYVLLLRDAVRFPDGSLGTYIRSVDEDEHAPGVVVLPLHQGHILLIRHFRHEKRDWQLEIPQGFGMPGLSSEESIRIELKEEIDATVSHLMPLGQVHLDTRSGANRVELFFAEIDSYGDVELQEGITELLPTPVAEVERMIREQEIDNVFLLVTFARAKLNGLI
jgi:ADP-ribose pyrophosphatase